jgi:hypothetical protein
MASFPLSVHGMAKGSGIGSELLRQTPKLVLFNVSRLVKSRTRRIRTNFIFGTTLMDNEVSRVIYVDFLPRALVDGRYVAAPGPYVVGKGSRFHTSRVRRSNRRRIRQEGGRLSVIAGFSLGWLLKHNHGASNNVITHMHAPSFEPASFQVPASGQKISISIQY